MLKKITSAILSVAMLFSAASVLAIDNTTYTDNFEQYDITEDTEYDADEFNSDIFYLHATKGTIMHNAGKDNSKALKVTSSANADTAIMLNQTHAGGSTEVLELSFDMKAGYNTGNKTVELGGRNLYGSYSVFRLGYDADNQLGTIMQCNADNTNGAVVATYSKDKWYRVVIRYKIGGAKEGYIFDDTGALIATGTNTRTYSGNIPVVNMKAASGIDIVLDNARLNHYDKNNAPSLIASESSVKNTDEGVPRNKTLSFVFDQEVASNSTISISRADGEEITEITDITTTKRYTDTLVLNYTGLLDKNTEYVISFANVSNGTKPCGTADISFTTEDLHFWNDVVVSSAEESEDDETLTDVTFEIGDKYGYPTFSGSVMAVLYQDGKMIAVDIKSLTNSPTGELTVGFDLGALPSDYDIGIILLDLEAGPIPLAGGMLEN